MEINNKKLKIISITDLKFNKKTFKCHSDALNHYFYTKASQDVRKGLTNCFVMIDEYNKKIVGFYTLAPHLINVSDITLVKGMDSGGYKHIPAILVGRLAIDKNYTGNRLGTLLIIDAIKKTINSPTGAKTLIVNAKDNSINFYKRLNFKSFNEEKNTLFYYIPKDIEQRYRK